MSTLIVPSPSLDWRLLYNVPIGNTGIGADDYRSLWYAIKQILCNEAPYAGTWKRMDGSAGVDPTACTVVLSSDSVTGPSSEADNTDRITAPNKVVWGNGTVTLAHSWIALQLPVGQLLLDFAGANGGVQLHAMNSHIETGAQPTASGGLFYSQNSGFATAGQYGTNSRRAWATDEAQIFNRRTPTTVTYLGNLSTTTTWTGKLHVMRTSDGTITRMVFCQNGVPIWYFFLEVPGSPFHTNGTPDHIWNVDDKPWFGAVYGSATMVPAGLYNGTPAWAGNTVNLVSRCASNLNPTARTVVNLYASTFWNPNLGDYLIAANATAPNNGDGGYVPLPMALGINTAGYMQPYAGTWQDLYLVGNNLSDGASGADNGTTYSWRKLGNFLLPAYVGLAVELS